MGPCLVRGKIVIPLVLGGCLIQVISEIPLSSYFFLGFEMNLIALFCCFLWTHTVSAITISHAWLFKFKSIK